MKLKIFLRVSILLTLLALFFPIGSVNALATTSLPPVDMFQLPWEQGSSWVALDGFDNGFRRLPNSPHNYLNGGAIDFAPHNNMKVGEDTSQFWVTAAAAGTVVELSKCHLKINHGNGWITEYQFLANIQVKLGEAVYRNQRLAVIADGLRQPFCPPVDPDVPHVHFTLRPDMRDATFAGWEIGYIPLLNKTTFTKNGETLGLYQPILNSPGLEVASRDPITWDTVYIGNVDPSRYENWPFTLTETTNFTVTVTPTTSGLLPLIVLLDANGNELARGTGTLTSTQPAGSYFIQIQAQEGSGFYNLTLHKNEQPVPTGPYTSTDVTPASVDVGGTAQVSVNMGNVPAEGYTSTEFTCTYNSNLVEVGNIAVTDLFGADPAVAINGPQDGSFIVAVAGSNGNRAMADGVAFTFDAQGSQAGQAVIDCKARVSKGDNTLTEIPSTSANLTILGSTPTPTPTPAPGETPTPTPSPTGDWLTFTDATYGFEFQYPSEGQIVDGGNDSDTRINLPFEQGTNLSEKYLEVVVTENPTTCQSPLATSSMLQSSETVNINGLSFLKETGGDGSAGHINTWTAYSTMRDNACVSLDFVLRATDPGVYTTPPPLFDEAAESAVFEQIVSTYVWQTITPTPTPQPETSGTLAGQVLASKPVTISVYNADATLATSATANEDGTFSLTVPAGTYTVIATASGFLDAQGQATLTDGQTTTLPTINLLAGDIDGNKVIDQFDAMTIGMSYNTAMPNAADLNNDGIINVLDLELLANNYRESGALAWQ